MHALIIITEMVASLDNYVFDENKALIIIKNLINSNSETILASAPLNAILTVNTSKIIISSKYKFYL